MERARTTWTDERLDGLSRRVDDGFNRVDSLQRLMIQMGGATTVAILATLLSVIATRG